MISVAERAADREESLRVMLEGAQANLQTAMPGIVTEYNAAEGTVSIQPAIRSVVALPDGTTRQQELPLLVDVPVVFPGGGGATLTFPIKPGDEALVVFASRPIDSWWQNGGVGAPVMPRMHSLSDGFALVGVRSKARALPAPNTTATVLRSDDGASSLALTPGSGNVTVVTPGTVQVTAPDIKLNGLVTIVGGLIVDGIVFGTHKHTNVVPGGGLSGGPTT